MVHSSGGMHHWNSSSWDSALSSTFSENNWDETRPLEEVEAAHLRPESISQFPWMQPHYEPIRTRRSATPASLEPRETIPSRQPSRTSIRSGPSESIPDLHLLISDSDYYAGAIHDYQAEEEAWAEEVDWDEEDGDVCWSMYPGGGTSSVVAATYYYPEKGRSSPQFSEKTPSNDSAKSEKDINLVTWDGPDDPDNPKNWTKRKRWQATIAVSLFTFISPVSSSMIAPGLTKVQSDLNMASPLLAQLSLSAFVLAFSVGPLFLGPLSELYGRRIVLQLSNLFYIIFNLAAGFSQTTVQLVVFRFLSGLGGSAPLGIGGGVLGDLWQPQERGKAMALYSLMPLLGPAVGPIAGGFIAQYSSWRWVFFSTCIVAAIVQIAGFFYLKETYAATILTWKKNRLKALTGNQDLRTEFDNPSRKTSTHLRTAFQRPFKLLFTQPIVQILALYIGYVYGTLYLVLGSFPVLWEQRYNQSVSIAGLNYISLGVGFYAGTQIAARSADKIYKSLKARNANAGRPEFRVPLMLPGAVMVPVGLLWYGWSAQAGAHWIVPNIGTAIFAAGNQLVFQNCQTYIVDSYTRFAASAIAATACLRSLGGFAFPLFAPAMYEALNYGWGNTVLAGFGIVIGVPVPCMLWWYGEKLRKKSKFAAG